MTSLKQINDFGALLAKEFHPEKIVLFGSYAYGRPSRDSDVDLLVIMPLKESPVDKSVEMRLKLKPNFPLDLLVRTPGAIKKRLDMGDCFIRDILEKGKVLYEGTHR